MTWGYLSEFWDAIGEVVVSANTYTIDWFQSIGNAVAGAIGALFEDLIHHIYDIFYVGQYLVDNLAVLFGILFTPLSWIFNLVKGFFDSAFQPAVESTISFPWNAEVLALFNAVPYWNVLMFSISAGLSILILDFILKRLSQF